MASFVQQLLQKVSYTIPGDAGRLKMAGISVVDVATGETETIEDRGAEIYWYGKTSNVFFVTGDYQSVKSYDPLTKRVNETRLPGVFFSPQEKFCINSLPSDSTQPLKIYVIDDLVNEKFHLFASFKKGLDPETLKWVSDSFLVFKTHIDNKPSFCLLNCATSECFLAHERIIVASDNENSFILKNKGGEFSQVSLSELERVPAERILSK